MIYDDVVSYEENLKIYSFILNKKNFSYGEVDTPQTPPTGLIYKFNECLEEDKIYVQKLKEIVFAREPELKTFDLYRAYINLFIPNERPFFHTDGLGYTCLFYFNPLFNFDEGGETQFIDEEIIGILPKPGRLVIFDGEVLHRATSFRNNPRITVALKFSPNSLYHV